MRTAPVALALTTTLALLGAACSKKNDTPPSEATGDTSASASAEVPASMATASESSVAAGRRRRTEVRAAGREIGIPECDEYVQKYEACLKASSARSSGAYLAFKAQRESFRIAADTPEGKTGLKATCQDLLAKLATNKICAGAP